MPRTVDGDGMAVEKSGRIGYEDPEIGSTDPKFYNFRRAAPVHVHEVAFEL
jgi:hypothetical protein